MRSRVRAAAIASGLLCCGAPAHAEGTWFVVPGRPDVPVIVNPLGCDASGMVVERDFGLDRPAQVNPTIIGPAIPPVWSPRHHFFPHSDSTPGYGRYEVQPSPDRKPPPAAQTYIRSWGTASDPLPASTDPPYPMTIQPFVGPWWGRGPRGR